MWCNSYFPCTAPLILNTRLCPEEVSAALLEGYAQGTWLGVTVGCPAGHVDGGAGLAPGGAHQCPCFIDATASSDITLFSPANHVAKLGKHFLIAHLFDKCGLCLCTSVPKSAAIWVHAVVGPLMGKIWNWSCGLVIAGRSAASAAQLHQFVSYHGAADLELALGAGWVRF